MENVGTSLRQEGLDLEDRVQPSQGVEAAPLVSSQRIAVRLNNRRQSEPQPLNRIQGNMGFRFLFFGLIMLSCLKHTLAQDMSEKLLQVVPTVDLSRYSGTWYEIARLPNKFQKECIGDVTATYTLLDNGEIKVVNRCRKGNGEITEAEGRARRASDDEPNSKLKVRFAPAFLSFLPFVWGDYWILELAPDYSYAVVGEPDRKYLWVLARSPKMDDGTLAGILDRVKQQGYDLRALIRTEQTQ
jgi:apolipoprotein D and lipocalin family protein